MPAVSKSPFTRFKSAAPAPLLCYSENRITGIIQVKCSCTSCCTLDGTSSSTYLGSVQVNVTTTCLDDGAAGCIGRTNSDGSLASSSSLGTNSDGASLTSGYGTVAKIQGISRSSATNGECSSCTEGVYCSWAVQ